MAPKPVATGMAYFRLATHFRSNTNITNDPELIVGVVQEMLSRGAQLLIMPAGITDEEYRELAAGREEQTDPVAIADWISIIPKSEPT